VQIVLHQGGDEMHIGRAEVVRTKDLGAAWQFLLLPYAKVIAYLEDGFYHKAINMMQYFSQRFQA